MKKQKRKLKKWVKNTIVIIIIGLALIPIIKLFDNMNAEDKEAYNNCMNKTNNQAYCNKIVYGIY